VIRYKPKIVIVAGGANDLGNSPEAMRQAADALFRRIRSALPDARLIALGPWVPQGDVWSNLRMHQAAIRAAVEASNGTFIDTSEWITGHGSTLHPLHDGGNADQYIGEASHPNASGYRYIGLRLADALRALPVGAGRP
jgi:lysophospholipase L1-like esterase